MTIQKRFPKLHERMEERGISPSASAGYLLDELNELMCPLGFRVIGEREPMQDVLQDAEAFLHYLDAR